GPLGDALADLRLHPVDVRLDVVPAVYRIDPRSVPLADMVTVATEVSRGIGAAQPSVRYNWVPVLTQLTRELFASTEGALIDQAFAVTQGAASVVAVGAETSQEIYDVMGHQRGWEVIGEGVGEPLLTFPPFRDFALALARDAAELAAAPALPTSEREVVVVTDPHYNTLVSHEIIGHPAELDRALKMETAYAGRSWLLADLDAHQMGRRIASPLVTAYADPARIIGAVDRGYYLVGHRIPSIAESRENFRISARKVYAIERGELTRLYRDGGIAADTRDYLMKVDAVGRDFRLYPIPNCGK